MNFPLPAEDYSKVLANYQELAKLKAKYESGDKS